MSPSPQSLPRPTDLRRGSVLIVTLVIAVAIAIALGSYLQLAQQTLRTATRAHYANVAMNLAETGLERGMVAISRELELGEAAWEHWTISADGRDAYRVFDGFDFGANTAGEVRVRVEDYQGVGAAVVLARSTVRLASGDTLERWLRVRCERSSPFANGLTGENVVVSGNGRYNSYSSKYGRYGALLADDTKNRSDRIFIGAAKLEMDPFFPGTTVIEGAVAVAGEESLKLAADAVIGPSGTSGTDAESVRFDFAMDFDDVTAPNYPGTTLSSITTSTTLPRTGDNAIILDGRKTFHYQISHGVLLTTEGAQLTIHDGTEENESGSAGVDVVLTVLSDVRITGPGTGIRVEGNSTLALYSSGDIIIRGAGVHNVGRPNQFQVWGTRPQTENVPQVVELLGHQGELASTVYGPNANVTVDGGASTAGRSVLGAVVGRKIKVANGSSFHYDESLRDSPHRFVYRVSQWEELSAAGQRAGATAALDF